MTLLALERDGVGVQSETIPAKTRVSKTGASKHTRGLYARRACTACVNPVMYYYYVVLYASNYPNALTKPCLMPYA